MEEEERKRMLDEIQSASDRKLSALLFILKTLVIIGGKTFSYLFSLACAALCYWLSSSLVGLANTPIDWLVLLTIHALVFRFYLEPRWNREMRPSLEETGEGIELIRDEIRKRKDGK